MLRTLANTMSICKPTRQPISSRMISILKILMLKQILSAQIRLVGKTSWKEGGTNHILGQKVPDVIPTGSRGKRLNIGRF